MHAVGAMDLWGISINMISRQSGMAGHIGISEKKQYRSLNAWRRSQAVIAIAAFTMWPMSAFFGPSIRCGAEREIIERYLHPDGRKNNSIFFLCENAYIPLLGWQKRTSSISYC
jgi:hypothetical protein